MQGQQQFSRSDQGEDNPQRSQRRTKLALGCLGVGMIGVTLLILGLMLMPVIFRNLDEAMQERIVRRLPFMQALMSTAVVPSNAVLPTVAATSANALALLTNMTNTPPAPVVASASPMPSSTLPPPTLTHVPPSATATQTITPLPPTLVTPTQTVVSGAMVVAVAAQITSSPTDLPTNMPMPSVTPTASMAVTVTPPPSATPTLTMTVTLIPPTSTATPLPVPTLIATASPYPLPASFTIQGKIKWEPQLFNNCGPANLVQVMRYLKWTDSQATVAAYLKPAQADKNVSPWQMVNYVNLYTNLRGVTRTAGNLNLMKRLLVEGYGVIMETGFYDPDDLDKGWIGHYLTVFGYDDAAGTLTWLDTFKNVRFDTYTNLDNLWQDFNRRYMVVYPPAREAELMAILGPNADEVFNAQYTLDLAKAEASANPQDAFAWFNMGSAFVALKQYQNAATAYDQAFSLNALPFRLMWYEFGPYEAYYQIGHYDRVLELAQFNLETTKEHEETAFYWRGMVHAARGEIDLAVEDFKRALAFNRNYIPATEAITQVQNGIFIAPLSQ